MITLYNRTLIFIIFEFYNYGYLYKMYRHLIETGDNLITFYTYRHYESCLYGINYLS